MRAQLWFYKGKGNWFDWLIRKYCNSRYSHVEIVVGGIACAADAWSGKVRTAPVTTFNRDNWDVVEVELQKDAPWLLNQVGKGYDWLGILGLITLGFDDPSRWYCSELAAAAMGLSPRQVSPGELYSKVSGDIA